MTYPVREVICYRQRSPDNRELRVHRWHKFNNLTYTNKYFPRRKNTRLSNNPTYKNTHFSNNPTHENTHFSIDPIHEKIALF